MEQGVGEMVTRIEIVAYFSKQGTNSLKTIYFKKKL
jgi:hypothetical protein